MHDRSSSAGVGGVHKALLAVLVLSLLAVVPVAPAAADGHEPGEVAGLEFVPLSPCAVFDSRSGTGGFAGRLAGGVSRTLRVAGAVPAAQGGSGCVAPPADAVAVKLNLVALDAEGRGNLRIAEAGVTPLGGAVNYRAGANNSNALPVEVSDTGHVDVSAVGGAVHIRGVVLGYYTDEAGLAFVPMSPCAVFDSRSGTGELAGRLAGGASRTLQVTGFVPAAQGGPGCPAPPANAVAVEVNLVAVSPQGAGNLRIAASGVTPGGGAVNFAAGVDNANALPVEVDLSGRVAVSNNAGGGAVHVRGVVLGYYTDVDAAGLEFLPLSACAVFDSRFGAGGLAGSLPGGASRTLQVTGAVPANQGGASCTAPPADAVAVEVNLVAVSPQGAGNLRIAASGVTPRGGAVNFAAGVDNANALPVEVDLSGRVAVSNVVGGGAVDIRGVVLGYYVGETVTCTDGTVLAIGDGGRPICSLEVVGDLSAGAWHTCAALTDGTAWCWGYAANGQLGDRARDDEDDGAGGDGEDRFIRTRAVQVTRQSDRQPLTGVVAVSGGDYHSCAVLDDGTAWCWGHGQLGDGTVHSTSVEGPEHHIIDPEDPPVGTRAVQVTRQSDEAPLTRVVSVSAGTYYSCASLDDGTAWCWGSTNYYGQLGDGTTTDRTRAVPVTRLSDAQPLTGVASVSAGDDHACATLREGTAWCWGRGELGQRGDGTDSVIRTRAVQVTRQTTAGPLTGVAAVSAGSLHSCAALADGTAACWGHGGYGQLGHGDTATRTRAVTVTRHSDAQPLTGVAGVAAGAYHSCASLGNGTAWCWGLGLNGRLGDGDTTSKPAAVQVTRSSDGGPLSGVAAVSIGWWHSCGALDDGTAWCWGEGGRGQIGDGSTVERHRAVQVTRHPG